MRRPRCTCGHRRTGCLLWCARVWGLA